MRSTKLAVALLIRTSATLSVTTAVTMVLAQASVAADTTESSAGHQPQHLLQQDASRAVVFNIKPQPISEALTKLGEQSGLTIIVETKVSRGIKATALSGEYTPEEALSKLLEPTGLKAEYLGGKTVAIRKASDGDFHETHTTRSGAETGIIRIAQAGSTNIAPLSSNASQGESPGPAATGSSSPPRAGAEGGVQEIVITATRREEALSRVPISVTAVTQENIDVRGIKDFQDVARFTPGVSIDNTGTSNISIRGIASTGGAGTTGIYIDDTPIQTRALNGGNAIDALPKSFDIDRVEVLRGPQGTLFGAGSEGGTVRYITTQPSLTKSSFYTRDEVSFTSGGEPSEEVGVAGGVPLIDGTLGVRATVWYRHDGGWIDRIDPNTLSLINTNANDGNTVMARLSAVWQVSDNWRVTPGMYYQRGVYRGLKSYWPIYSNPGSDRYVSADPLNTSAPDRFYLPSIKVDGDIGTVHFVSNTSYFDRRVETGYDDTLFNLGFFQSLIGPTDANGHYLPPFPLLDGTGFHLPGPVQNYRAPVTLYDTQKNFTQELRLQSNDPTSSFVWTTGVFFSVAKQYEPFYIHDPDLNNFLAYFGKTIVGVFNEPLSPEGDSWHVETHGRDKQIAVFGEGTYSFTDQFKLTVGARFSKTQFAFTNYTGGAQLFGPPTTSGGEEKQNAFTPKVNFSYQMDSANLFYATYSKGFRPGGVNSPIPAAACAADFETFGISATPETYKSDSTQSYEVGAKNNFGHRLQLASSVYYIKWNDIQQSVNLPTCGVAFTDNLGAAVAKGIDIQADAEIVDHLTFQAALGLTEARYTKDLKLSPTQVTPVAAEGDSIEGANGQPPPPFTATVGLQYTFGMFSRDAFVRGDYEYAAHSKWLGPSQNPNTLQYQSADFQLPSTGFTSVRAGMKFHEAEVAIFVNNLFDEHPLAGYQFSVGSNDITRLQRDFTFRPRTIGLSFTIRE